MDARSGRHWIAWANTHARNSRRIEDLDSMFRRKIEAFTYGLAAEDGARTAIDYMHNVNSNIALHAVGASYGMLKLRSDAPHWSFNGR